MTETFTDRLMSSHTLPQVNISKWRAALNQSELFQVSICADPVYFHRRLTGGAGTARHAGDESLLFAGRLSPVAFVLVGVSVWAAHGDVAFVALKIKHNQMLIKSQSDSHHTAQTWLGLFIMQREHWWAAAKVSACFTQQVTIPLGMLNTN